MLNFAANISTMFTNLPMHERYLEAANYGFKAVESQFIYDANAKNLNELREKAGVKHVLMNVPVGEDDFGVACIPGREMEFVDSIKAVCFHHAFHLRIKKLHILAGLVPAGYEKEEEYLEYRYVENLKSVCEMLEDHCIVGLIEPLCSSVKQNYYLSSFEKAAEIIKKVDHDNIKLLLDVFHLYKIEGSVDNLEKYYEIAGHVQVSQSPDRSEPSITGDINYGDVFKRLEKLNHTDFIGLEYHPTSPIRKSLSWMKDFGIKLWK